MEIVKNKKAFFDYEILETYEAGVVLKGHEVKSIRNHKILIKGGYVSIRQNEVWLENIQISPYQAKNQTAEDGLRTLKLLLKASEIARLVNQSEAQGVTVIPLSVFTKNGKIKFAIGVCKGKKTYDKRQTIKNRESKREIQRSFKAH